MAAIYDAAWWGWTGTREQLRERMPDMDDADVDKITQLMSGARESGRARRERMAGIPIDTSRILDLPSLVIVPASKLGVVDAHDHLFLRSAALSGDELDDLDRSAPDRHY